MSPTIIEIPADLRPAGSGLPETFRVERNDEALGGVVVRQRITGDAEDEHRYHG